MSIEQLLHNKMDKQAPPLILQRELLYISEAEIYILKIDMIRKEASQIKISTLPDNLGSWNSNDRRQPSRNRELNAVPTWELWQLLIIVTPVIF